jgi:hypothetical protein
LSDDHGECLGGHGRGAGEDAAAACAAPALIASSVLTVGTATACDDEILNITQRTACNKITRRSEHMQRIQLTVNIDDGFSTTRSVGSDRVPDDDYTVAACAADACAKVLRII